MALSSMHSFDIDNFFQANNWGTTSLPGLFPDLVPEDEGWSHATTTSDSLSRLEFPSIGGTVVISGGNTGFESTDNNHIQSLAIPRSGTTSEKDSGSQPAEEQSESDSIPEPRRNNLRFSKKSRSVLRSWFNSHKDNPYPTAEDRLDLQKRTQLQPSQISLWFVNARRRHWSRKQIFTAPDAPKDFRIAPSISQGELLPPADLQSSLMLPPEWPLPELDIDALQQQFVDMNPFERWRADMDLEHEPASLPDIASAIAHSPAINLDIIDPVSQYSASLVDYQDRSNSSASVLDTVWAHSMASYGTGLTSLTNGSTAEGLEARSCRTALPKVIRRRCVAKRGAKINPNSSTGGKFHCTFCSDRSFKTKHDWQRHEKSQHMTVESWACCLGEATLDTKGTIESPEGEFCAFCKELNPDADHLETHNYSACQEKSISKRMFYRKDHFQQHLRLVHECEFNPRMDKWRADVSDVKSRCGFCSLALDSWQERADHLAAHFKAGATMEYWQGDLGLQSQIP